jgi:hypothetical protein
MRKLEKNTRRYFVNLFADYILSKFDKSENTIIQVTGFENFVVVNGQTTSSKVLDLNDIKYEFSGWFDDLLSSLDIKEINLIDVIKYEQEIPEFSKGWINVNKSLYVEEYEPISEITINSEFPYGHSLGCGRAMYYYSHYIFNHMYSLLGVDQLYFRYSSQLDENEDYKIKVVSKSSINNSKIESLVLDVFDMDLTDFREKLSNYQLFDDITDPNSQKPYLVQDRIKDVILL